MNRLNRVALPLTLLAAVTAAAAAFAGAPADAPPAAVWQKQQYRFQFMGFTTTYSCDGLADKLALLLKYAGARKDVKAYPGACAAGGGRPDKFASADLTFYTLAPASGAANETTVPATWRTVQIQDRKPRELGRGDCELVEQFRSNVLPMFTTRNVASQTTCIPNQLSGSSIALTFEALASPPLAPKAKIP